METIFVVLCERCLLRLPDPISRELAIEKCAVKTADRCPRCGPIERVRLLPETHESDKR